MKPSVFDLEEERLRKEVLKRGAKRVLIQLPEGLKPQGPKLAALVEKTGAMAIVSADPCYGACDLSLYEAESLGADLVVHFGHSPLGSRPERVPVLYIEAKTTLSVKTAVEQALSLLQPWKDIGLVATVQHVDMLAETRESLLKAGKRVAIGDAGRLKYAGQVIGCDYSNAHAIAKDVDAFLLVSGGRFHAVGVALATSKPTIVSDPYERRAYSVELEVQRIIRQRWASIQKAMKSKHFGILIGLKTWQRQTEKAFQVKDKLEATGKETTVFAAHEITAESLMAFPTIDTYVNTACPRISLEASDRFQRPVLTINEALVVTGELTWGQLLEKSWFES